MEEATNIPEPTIKDIIIPTLTLDTSALVALSTLHRDEDNFFNRLVKDANFPSYSISYVCPGCRDKGELDVCVHSRDRVPHWSNEDRVKDIKLLLGEGEDERYARENLGFSQQSDHHCFAETKVNEFFAKPFFRIREHINHIFVTIDPCAGTENVKRADSEYAIVSLCGAQDIIIGLDSFDAPEHTVIERMIYNHLYKLRQIPFCENATFVIDMESGTGQEASRVIAFITSHAEFRPVIALSEFVRKYGTKTGNAMKRECMITTRDSLYRGNMYIAKDLVTNDPLGVNHILSKFKKQFLKYSRIVRPGKSIHHMNQETFTGKVSFTDKDDIIFTVQRAIRRKLLFYLEGKYAHFYE